MSTHAAVYFDISLATPDIRVRLVQLNMFTPSSNFLLAVPRWCFFCGSFLLFVVRVCLCPTVLPVTCSLVVTCWERADLLALLLVMLSCALSFFIWYGVLGQVGCLIASIPDNCPLPYFAVCMTGSTDSCELMLIISIQYICIQEPSNRPKLHIGR